MSALSKLDWVAFGAGVATVVCARVVCITVLSVIARVQKAAQRRAAEPAHQLALLRLRRQLVEANEWALSNLDSPTPSPSLITTIASAKVVDLIDGLKRGDFTAVTLLKAYLLRAIEANTKTNCLTEIILGAAIREAKSADEKYAAFRRNSSGGQAAAAHPLLGSLEGIPISIKESLDVVGCDSTCGLVSRIDKPAVDDAAVVTLLRRAGAVIFVKTNVPALLLSYECDSNVHGIATNPHNASNTPGGSSGGEGALIALGGSAGGIGTDIGGSIRIPAHFCGICGLKPSMSRVALRGSNPKGGQEGVAPVAGPMARSVRDLTVLFRALTPGPQFPVGLDGMVNHVPFQEDCYLAAKSKKHLRVAYYFDDGFVPASPACRRAVLEVVAALTREGHECVQWTPPNSEQIISSFFQLLSADGGKTLKDNLAFDPPNGVVAPLLAMASLPDWLKQVVSVFISRTVDPVFGKMLGTMVNRSVDQYYKLLYTRNNLRHAFAKEMQGYDFIVAPGFVVPAPKCGSTTQLSFSTNYTALYNVLDLPVVVVPVTKVKPALDAWTPDAISRAKNTGMTKKISEIYNPEQMAGLPVGVQIVTPRMTEEAALANAERVETLLASV